MTRPQSLRAHVPGSARPQPRPATAPAARPVGQDGTMRGQDAGGTARRPRPSPSAARRWSRTAGSAGCARRTRPTTSLVVEVEVGRGRGRRPRRCARCRRRWGWCRREMAAGRVRSGSPGGEVEPGQPPGIHAVGGHQAQRVLAEVGGRVAEVAAAVVAVHDGADDPVRAAEDLGGLGRPRRRAGARATPVEDHGVTGSPRRRRRRAATTSKPCRSPSSRSSVDVAGVADAEAGCPCRRRRTRASERLARSVCATKSSGVCWANSWVKSSTSRPSRPASASRSSRMRPGVMSCGRALAGGARRPGAGRR